MMYFTYIMWVFFYIFNLALLPYSKKVLVSVPGQVRVLPVSAWVPSRCSGFLPQSKDLQVRLICASKLPVCECVRLC